MRKLELGKASSPLADYARGVKREPLILLDSGRPVAALVAVRDADLETVTLSTHPTFMAVIERSRIRHQEEGGISTPEIRRRLGLNDTRSNKSRRKPHS